MQCPRVCNSVQKCATSRSVRRARVCNVHQCGICNRAQRVAMCNHRGTCINVHCATLCTVQTCVVCNVQCATMCTVCNVQRCACNVQKFSFCNTMQSASMCNVQQRTMGNVGLCATGLSVQQCPMCTTMAHTAHNYAQHTAVH